jgi:hypothetical protein
MVEVVQMSFESVHAVSELVQDEQEYVHKDKPLPHNQNT